MEEKPPDAVEPRPTLSVTLPAAPSMKRAGGAAALLHGLHLLLCVFSNAVYVSNEPGDDVLYPGQGYVFSITDKGKPNVMQRQGSFVVTIQAALLFGFVVSLHALMLEYWSLEKQQNRRSHTPACTRSWCRSLLRPERHLNAIDTSDIVPCSAHGCSSPCWRWLLPAPSSSPARGAGDGRGPLLEAAIPVGTRD